MRIAADDDQYEGLIRPQLVQRVGDRRIDDVDLVQLTRRAAARSSGSPQTLLEVGPLCRLTLRARHRRRTNRRRRVPRPLHQGGPALSRHHAQHGVYGLTNCSQ